ncbi:hypothetical protein SH1V18_32870 [Vallitalea longa]|uniref:Endospore appendages core domain-containing protein n=1 Tax=Vallitalea longa TaxID=2936439 RepID=A0A9W5YC76_9FIRM|nr:S-Ena type endospore appendage [Vallitalea longa]GKX30807.1 hypothetical protein SH1V18_32870 [Vallitalea longa]
MYRTCTKTRCTKCYCREDDCKKEPDCYITDVISNKFELRRKCFSTIWEGIGIKAAVTIKIENQSDCLLRLRFKGKECVIVKVLPHEEKSITIQNVNSIAAQCLCRSDEEFCFGCYEIAVHYISDLKRKGEKCTICDEDYTKWYSISCVY